MQSWVVLKRVEGMEGRKGGITWVVEQLRDKGPNWEVSGWPGQGLEG